MKEYPKVYDENKVGEYPALAKAGGGYVWDEVLEYRVWCHPERGAKDLENGNDYYYAFSTYQDALKFCEENEGTEEPLALILQKEYIDEPETGKFIRKKERRITEWPVQFLSRPKRNENTLLNFFAKDAPANRLDIIRGLKEGESFPKEEIFVLEIKEQINRAIIIEGDDHTVWAYLLETIGEEKNLLFDGFVCSRGTIVNESNEVKNFINQELQPPLLKEYKNEFSIQDKLSDDDFRIEWKLDSDKIEIFLKNKLFLIMDTKNKKSYSKSVLSDGPYGSPISQYINE